MKSLEDELGYPIFKRTSNGSVPTPEGYLFIQSAKAYPGGNGENKGDPAACRHRRHHLHHLQLVSSDPSKPGGFQRAGSPETHDTYRETSIRQNFECIYENQYRLAIIDCFHTLSEMYQERAANTKLEAVVMKERVPAVALMSKHHPLAHQESVTMKEIYAYPLVLFEDYQDPEQHRLLKLQPRQQILYLFDRGSLLDVVQTSNSISILKKNTYVDSAQYGIAELPIRDCPDSYDIVMLKRSYYQMNRREEAFIRYLQAQL